MRKPISFFDTYIDTTAADEVAATLKSERLSEGEGVRKFETMLANTLGIRAPVAVNSGTSALHLALTVAGVGPGDEVILPAQTFVACGLTVLQQHAVPVFADISLESGNIDPASISAKITPKTKAIMPVHWAGMPCDMDEIHAIAQAHDLTVIEDAAHALGATYKGKSIGSISPLTCLSFQAIKHVTTGDGGALVCLDDAMEREARAKRWFGIDRERAAPSELGERQYDLPAIGFKYHMNDYAASLGRANLRTFTERLAQRRRIAALYREKLQGIPGLTLLLAPRDRESAWWLFGVRVEKRHDFIRAMNSAEIPVSVVHQGIDKYSVLGGLRQDLEAQRQFDSEQIHLPIHDRIGEEEVEYVTDVIKKGW